MKVLKNIVFPYLLTVLTIGCNSPESCELYIGRYTDSEVNENTHCAKHLEISKTKAGFLVKQTMEQRMNFTCNHQWDSEAIYECKEGILVNEDDGKKKRLILEEGNHVLREGTGTQKWLKDNQNIEESSYKKETTNSSDSESVINEKKEHYTTDNELEPSKSVKSVVEISKNFERLWKKMSIDGQGKTVHGKCSDLSYLEENDWLIIHYSKNNKEKEEEEIQTWVFKSGLLCYYEIGFIGGAQGNLFSSMYHYVGSSVKCKESNGRTVENTKCDNQEARKYLTQSDNIYQLYKSGKIKEGVEYNCVK